MIRKASTGDLFSRACRVSDLSTFSVLYLLLLVFPPNKEPALLRKEKDSSNHDDGRFRRWPNVIGQERDISAGNVM